MDTALPPSLKLRRARSTFNNPITSEEFRDKPMANILMFLVIGVVEMFIVTAWTKIVAGSQVAMSGAITFVNVLIWYFVIEQIVTNHMTLPVLVTYAAGCALGTMIGTHFVEKPVHKRKAKVQKRSEHIAAIEHAPATAV